MTCKRRIDKKSSNPIFFNKMVNISTLKSLLEGTCPYQIIDTETALDTLFSMKNSKLSYNTYYMISFNNYGLVLIILL